jgi:leader peptidase (prepilin peptidase)/N-methyltransferase
VSAETVELVIVALAGLAIGSFLNVVIHRLPRNRSVVTPGSHCLNCEAPLTWYDNVPLGSYIMLGGRCRRCRSRISVRYPIVEAVTASVFVAHYLVFGWTPLLAVRLAFAAAMIALFAIDLEHHLLPDAITLPGILGGLACSFFLPPGLTSALIGALAGGGFLWLVGEAYFRYAGEEGMGGGDVKMLAMIGAVLGWQLTLLTLVLSSILGSVVGIAIIVARRGGLKSALPFGSFLALAALIASVLGDRILAWYVGRM